MKLLGFSLIELMVVLSIIALLAMFALPSFKNYMAKAKRAEAYAMLSSLATAERIYWADHGRYTTLLSGSQGAGWKPEGYTSGGSSERFYYTYGFPGSEGSNYFTGKLNTPSSDLSSAYANNNEFLAIAAGDIDGDGTADILAVDHHGSISLLQDDLQ